MESLEKNLNQESLPNRELIKKAFAERLDLEGWMSVNGEDYCGDCWKKNPNMVGVVSTQPLSEVLDYRDNGTYFSVQCGRSDCTNKSGLLFSEEYSNKDLNPNT